MGILWGNCYKAMLDCNYNQQSAIIDITYVANFKMPS
jgi:hypothetical protein